MDTSPSEVKSITCISGHAFAPSLILPYSFAVVWFDKAGASLTTLLSAVVFPPAGAPTVHPTPFAVIVHFVVSSPATYAEVPM